MQVFANRLDPSYLESLSTSLSLDGPKGLVETALPITPFRDHQSEIHHAISIDYLGITASTLLDRGGLITKYCFFDRLSQVAHEVNRLNSNGYLFKLRLLLLYPYCAAALIRIQAETSVRRTSIKEPKYTRTGARGDLFLEELTAETVHRSSLYRAQMVALPS